LNASREWERPIYLAPIIEHQIRRRNSGRLKISSAGVLPKSIKSKVKYSKDKFWI
jgi:hypothetical protein